MRSLIIIAVVLSALLACLVAPSRAEEPAEPARVPPAQAQPAPDEIAGWICDGSDAALDRAADAASRLDTRGLRNVFVAVKSHQRVRSKLKAHEIKRMDFKDATFAFMLEFIRAKTGITFFVSPRARKATERLLFTLVVDGITAHELLQSVTQPHELAWQIRGDVVVIDKAEHATDSLRAKISTMTVSLTLDEASFAEAVAQLAKASGIAITVDPSVTSLVAGVVVSQLQFTDVSLTALLNMMVAQSGSEDVIWTTQGKGIVVTRKPQ